MFQNGFFRIFIRDITLLVLTVLAWIILGSISANESVLGHYLTVILGLSGGALLFVFHEWGHFIFAKAIGAKLRAPATLKTLYLFGFPKEQNTRLQFIVMALGGFMATAAGLYVVFTFLPSGWPATHMVQGLGLLLLTIILILEVPGFILGIVSYEKLPSVDVLKS